ncbi:MAG TPA: phospholipase [Candidatus Angelobacter sp.]|jgi:predicted peptidase|nr:phospholipase [Candidatus Angelobacter sp.]
MITRREAVRLLGSASAAAWFKVAQIGFNFALPLNAFAKAASGDFTPALAPGAPMSPEREALIDAFKKQSEGLEKRFEARTYKSDWVMPYRLFRPEATGKLPLIVYLHGSGGLGDDNEKQLGLGNIFGTRVWLLPENQKNFPCYVLAPQTDRGWARYDLSQQNEGPAKVLPGLGEGSRLALEIIDALRREFARSIDERRIYVTGQSMGGAGVWNVITHRPKFFAAAVPCCGSGSTDDGTGSIDTPLWNFHGDSDQTVPVSASRDRIAARRKAGGRPLYTEYAGVDHNVWQWAYTEPALVKWVFDQRRP